MVPEFTWRGRRFHNVISAINPDRLYVEDWTTAERFLVPTPCAREDELIFNIPTDPRWIYIGNRNPSDEMLPEYLAIGADKWKLPDLEAMFPNRPAPLAS